VGKARAIGTAHDGQPMRDWLGEPVGPPSSASLRKRSLQHMGKGDSREAPSKGRRTSRSPSTRRDKGGKSPRARSSGAKGDDAGKGQRARSPWNRYSKPPRDAPMVSSGGAILNRAAPATTPFGSAPSKGYGDRAHTGSQDHSQWTDQEWYDWQMRFHGSVDSKYLYLQPRYYGSDAGSAGAGSSGAAAAAAAPATRAELGRRVYPKTNPEAHSGSSDRHVIPLVGDVDPGTHWPIWVQKPPQFAGACPVIPGNVVVTKGIVQHPEPIKDDAITRKRTKELCAHPMAGCDNNPYGTNCNGFDICRYFNEGCCPMGDSGQWCRQWTKNGNVVIRHHICSLKVFTHDSDEEQKVCGGDHPAHLCPQWNEVMQRCRQTAGFAECWRFEMGDHGAALAAAVFTPFAELLCEKPTSTEIEQASAKAQLALEHKRIEQEVQLEAEAAARLNAETTQVYAVGRTAADDTVSEATASEIIGKGRPKDGDNNSLFST
jgi:hypothetical protein